MGLVTHLMVSHTWSIKGEKRVEGSPSHLSFKGFCWTLPGSMSHIHHTDLTETFLSDPLMLSSCHPNPWFFIISQNPHLCHWHRDDQIEGFGMWQTLFMTHL